MGKTALGKGEEQHILCGERWQKIDREENSCRKLSKKAILSQLALVKVIIGKGKEITNRDTEFK